MPKSKLNSFIPLRAPPAVYTSPKMASLPPHLRMTSPAHKENKTEPTFSTDEQPCKPQEQSPKRHETLRKSWPRKFMTPKQKRHYHENKQANLEQQYAHSELLRQNCDVRDFQIEVDAQETDPEVQRQRLIRTQGHSNEELAAHDIKHRDFQAEAAERDICELNTMMLKKLDVRARAVHMLEHRQVLRGYVERSEDFPEDENMIEETIEGFVKEQVARKTGKEEALALAEEAEKRAAVEEEAERRAAVEAELERMARKARETAEKLAREVAEMNQAGEEDGEGEDEAETDKIVGVKINRGDAQDSPVGKENRRSATIDTDDTEESATHNEPKSNVGKSVSPAKTVRQPCVTIEDPWIWRPCNMPTDEHDRSIDEQIAASIDQEIVSGSFRPTARDRQRPNVATREEAGWEQWVEHAEAAGEKAEV